MSRSSFLAAFVALAACGRTPPGLSTSSSAGGAGDGPATTGGVDSDVPPGHSGRLPDSTGSDTDPTATTLTDTTESTSTGEPSCIDSPDLCTAAISLRRAVDILFVIDNSGSMGGEQGTLAQNFASFIDVLENQQVGANYRIGITTSAGDGGLRATSCRTRLNEFTFTWQFGTIDERQRGCLDNCDIDLITIPEPWVEKSSGQTNLPPGVGMTEVLQCIGPQGINGPGFERPLEAMRNALLDDLEGFVRDDALLAVIFVTDEADCSMSESNMSWISSDAGSVFWTHPDRSSSGVCWAAGVSCEGGPGVYDDCVVADKDRDGLITSDEDEAVLFPVQRYIDVLTDISEQKQMDGGQGEVLVALLAGVPLDYPDTGEIIYEDSAFEDFNLEYGIGPGCGQGTETVHSPPGIPPVRLRQFAEAFATEERNIHSICSDDYSAPLEQIADAIGEVSERACFNGCVVDAEPETASLEPDCTLFETFTGATPDMPVPPCTVLKGGWAFPSPDVDACYLALTDPDESTPNDVDDMSPQCVTVGSNLEFVIERRPGVPIAAGTSVEVSCQLEAPVGTTCDEV
ncbi:MAG: hypothetical protein AAF799_11950 [Myxococcota bacterium]